MAVWGVVNSKSRPERLPGSEKMTLNCTGQLSERAVLPGIEGLQGNLQLSYTFPFHSVCQHSYLSVWHSGDGRLFRLDFLRDCFCVKMLIPWCNTPQTLWHSATSLFSFRKFCFEFASLVLRTYCCDVSALNFPDIICQSLGPPIWHPWTFFR